ncbi:Fic family protein [Campylobacter concisus]
MVIHPYDDGNGRMARALAHYFFYLQHYLCK